MQILFGYLRQYWKLVLIALVLAAINQVFSLLDPLIFRHIIDSYATKNDQYTRGQFFRGVGLLLLAAVGVAFVSRVAKNFQDYCVNVITQRLGAQMYSDGVRHSLGLPYSTFEDQRSGETLGKLQKARSDTERFVTAAVIVVATQLWDDSPPEVWGTAVRLRDAGYDRHEILHMLARPVSEQIWGALHEERPYDHDRHVAALQALPGTWERERTARTAARRHDDARKQARRAGRAARRRNRRPS